MKNRFTLFAMLLISTGILAQSPVKVDFDKDERALDEVHEPGYESWVITNCVDTTKVINGIKITMANGKESDGASLQSHWHKVGIQAPYYARLVSDGLTVNGGDMYAEIDMTIEGLAPGSHSLLTYHNTLDSPDDKTFGMIDVFVNGELKVEGLMQSNRALSTYDAATAYVTFDVKENEPVVVTFRSNEDSPSDASWNIVINGFCLDVPDAGKQAKSPFPADRDLHAEVENGNCTLKWTAAQSAVLHDVYLGTDLNLVTNADKTSSCYKASQTNTTFDCTNLYSMNTYYWRVDEVEEDGTVTKGEVWSFMPCQLAFPGAEGYGRYARGGRGGKVVYVTNLNDAGPGSFREAVTNGSGPRTVLFAVSGIVRLESRIMSNEQITIAGQTAPGKGVCFRAAPIGINSESVCRFLRIRLGGGTTYDGLGMAGTNHSIVDHCSVSWTIDEAFSSRGAKNLTLQRTLISEALNCAGHQNYPAGTEHGYAGTISGQTGSFHHNLLAHCNGRNWSVGDAIDGSGTWVSKLDVFNNVVYNYGSRATDGEVHKLNFVNNYYKKGAATTVGHILKLEIKGFGAGTEQAYYSGNIIEDKNGDLLNDGTDNQFGRIYTLDSGSSEPTYEVFPDEPFFPSYATIHTAKDAYKSVLSDVGCNLPLLDEHDQRIVRETLEGSYTYVGSETGKKGLIDNEADAGGYENYPEITIDLDEFDTDRDGLPNWWEEMFGLNPNSPEGDFSDSNADDDRDGYTNLEEYLHWMATPHYEVKTGETVEIDLTKYTRGFEKNPVYTVTKIDNGTATVDGNILKITPEESFGGIFYVDFTVTDAEGSACTRNIGVKVGDRAVGVEPVSDTRQFAVNAYPNPVTDYLYVSTESTGDAKIQVMNAYGNSVLTETCNVSPNVACKLDVSFLPMGIYFLKIQQEGLSETIKFIKK